MAQVAFYRYVDKNEKDLITKEKRIQPGPGQSYKYFTPDRYDSGADAERWLALHYRPEYRIGPIPADEVPDFDHIPLRVVGPANGQPGGGLEAATTQPLYLFEYHGLL
jgi:hypothetical protein